MPRDSLSTAIRLREVTISELLVEEGFMRKFKLFANLFLVVFLFSVLFGCGTVPTKKEPETGAGPVFYPPLPNAPRIQYLASFSSAADLGKAKGGFADFVVGKDPRETVAVKKPYGVAINDGKIYVADTGSGAYAVFDLRAKKLSYVTGSGGGRMVKPINITVDKDGTKYVSDTALNQVLAFDRDDNFVKAYGVKDQFKPAGVVVTADKVYISDLKNNKIHVLDKASGKTVFEIGKSGKNIGELYYPTNMVIGPDNFLYVTEIGNFRVQKFTLDGKPIRAYGEAGDRPGQFARPKGVAVDRHGNIYTVDAAFENVQIFDSEGRLLLFFGSPGGNREDINLPTSMVIDYENAPLFQQYADPRFKIEYVILVASQFGLSKVNVYGYGRMDGMDYTVRAPVPQMEAPAQKEPAAQGSASPGGGALQGGAPPPPLAPVPE